MNKTIEYYNKNAKDYFETTINGNMKLSYKKFLEYIPKKGYILDFGCGSGRDSKYFIENGYKIKAIDGSLELCLLAEKYMNHKVIHMNFSELNDLNKYDGIWSCATILHLTKQEFIKVLKKMIRALKKDGIIYISFKDGIGEETKDGRYFMYYTENQFEEIINLFDKIEILDKYITYSSTNPNEERKWNNYLLKKIK